ncbi:MAG: J domain-containing protein [Planctomycetes bacterium]|nr:J domain-containing protein [Planctomycetota bacterium]
MANPYRVLDVPDGADDQEVRAAYLALVRRFPPERAPEEFGRLRAAYAALRDARSRLRFFLFEPSAGESIDEWLEELRCETNGSRLSLEKLRRAARGG